MARVPSGVNTHHQYRNLLAGNINEIETHLFVWQAMHLIIEEVLGEKVSNRLGCGYCRKALPKEVVHDV